MKLLYITYAMDRGDEVAGHAHDWVAAMARRFESIRVICIRSGDMDLPANVRVDSMGKERGAGRPAQLAAFLRAAREGIRGCDAVFCQFSSTFVISIFPFALLWGRPIVFWWTHKRRHWTLELALRLCDRVVTASPGSFPIASPKVRVVGHGIDTGRFAPAEGGRPEGGPFTIVSVGRLSAVKRLEDLIEGARILRDRRPSADFRLELVGAAMRPEDAAYRDGLVRRVAEAGLAERVVFAGGRPYREVLAHYRGADCFVNMCATGGVDKAVLEAMSCGLPVVTSNASFREVLEPEAADRWVIGPDPVALADRLEALLAMGPSGRAGVGSAMRAVVAREYGLSRLADRIHEECAGLVRKGPGTRQGREAGHGRHAIA